MRLWDRKGVGVGEYKAGRLHLVTFLPESSANTAATTHDAAKLGRGGRRGNALLAVLATTWPCLGITGLRLGSLALCYCPSPSQGLDTNNLKWTVVVIVFLNVKLSIYVGHMAGFLSITGIVLEILKTWVFISYVVCFKCFTFSSEVLFTGFFQFFFKVIPRVIFS